MALWTEALASAIDPVKTQPTDGESWKMWDTDEASMSLSCYQRVSTDLRPSQLRVALLELSSAIIPQHSPFLLLQWT